MRVHRRYVRLMNHDVKRIYDEFQTLQPRPICKSATWDGQQVIMVALSPDAVKAAFLTGELIATLSKMRGLKEWIVSNEAWRSSGFRGQLAVALYFKDDLTKAYDYIKLGKPDEGDIKLGNFICNVCTSSHPYIEPLENLMLIDMERFRLKPYPIYIGAQCFNNDVIIWGWVTWDEVKSWPHKSFGEYPEAYYKPFKALRPIIELKQLISASD